MKLSNYLKIVILLSVLSISIAWFDVYKTQEYKIVSKYLVEEELIN